MTEDAAIHIILTLQGLYTSTHSNRSQLGANRLTPRHRSTVTKLAATATVLLSRVWAHPPARGRLGTVKPPYAWTPHDPASRET